MRCDVGELLRLHMSGADAAAAAAHAFIWAHKCVHAFVFCLIHPEHIQHQSGGDGGSPKLTERNGGKDDRNTHTLAKCGKLPAFGARGEGVFTIAENETILELHLIRLTGVGSYVCFTGRNANIQIV